MDAVVPNGTFSDATCADYTDDAVGVTVVSEVSMPLVIPAGMTGGLVDNSVHSVVMDLLVTAVSSGEFTTQLQSFARRLSMSSAVADSVEVSTFSPTPAPTMIPTASPTPSPSMAPTPSPTTAECTNGIYDASNNEVRLSRARRS